MAFFRVILCSLTLRAGYPAVRFLLRVVEASLETTVWLSLQCTILVVCVDSQRVYDEKDSSVAVYIIEAVGQLQPRYSLFGLHSSNCSEHHFRR